MPGAKDMNPTTFQAMLQNGTLKQACIASLPTPPAPTILLAFLFLFFQRRPRQAKIDDSVLRMLTPMFAVGVMDAPAGTWDWSKLKNNVTTQAPTLICADAPAKRIHP